MAFVDEMGSRAPLRLVATRGASARQGASQPGGERHLAGEYEHGRDRADAGRRRLHNEGVFEVYLEHFLAPA